MRIFKIYLGINFIVAAISVFIAGVSVGDKSMIIGSIFFAVISVLLLKKAKKDKVRIAAKKSAMLLQPVNLWTGRYTFNSPEIPYRDTQEIQEQYSLTQATDEFRIMKESYEIAKNTHNLSTFCSRYELCQGYAHKILLAEQADVPGIYSLNAHNICISIIEAADNLRLRAFYDCISSQVLKADMFESENRKKLMCYQSAMELMETYRDLFSDMRAYKEEYEITQKHIEQLELLERTRELTETFPEQLYDSISVTTKRVADPDDDVVTQFLSLYGQSSQAICKGFTDLITDAYNTQDIDEKIYLLQRALEAYAYAKKWHYNHSFAGAKTFFQNTWERTINHNGIQCSWEQEMADKLMKYTMIRDNVIPWILDNAEIGFKQSEIYKVFPDIRQSELRDIISSLVERGRIRKDKKGNTYYISLPSTQMDFEAVN